MTIYQRELCSLNLPRPLSGASPPSLWADSTFNGARWAAPHVSGGAVFVCLGGHIGAACPSTRPDDQPQLVYPQI